MKIYYSVSECIKDFPLMSVLTNDDGTFSPIDPPVISETIAPVSAWQLRKALNARGMREPIELLVKNSPYQDLRDGWEYATEFYVDNPFVAAMGQAIGKTPDEMKELWAFAATL